MPSGIAFILIGSFPSCFSAIYVHPNMDHLLINSASEKIPASLKIPGPK